MSTKPYSSDDLLCMALELEAQALDHDDATATHERLKHTLVSLGVDPAYIARAASLLDERAVSARRRRLLCALSLAAVVTISGLAVGAWLFLRPSPPWRASLDAAHWSVHVNPESSGALARVPEASEGIGLPAIFVDYLKPSVHGIWQADLATSEVAELDGHEALSLELQSSLPRARIVLIGGPDERWVSPLVELDEAWKTHTLTLRSFEHQRLTSGGWRRISRSAYHEPDRAESLVISLGRPANPKHASGWLRVRGIVAH